MFSRVAVGQIYSTGGSGLWDDPTTWEGGDVPGPEDDVVITSGSTVVIEAEGFQLVEVHVGALAIEEGATHRGDGRVHLHVHGALTNEGTIDGSSSFTVYAYEDVNSPGLSSARFELSGTGRRTIRILDTPRTISSDGDVVLVGENISPGLFTAEGRLVLEQGAVWQILRSDAIGNIGGSFVSNNFDNQGVVIGNCAVHVLGTELVSCGGASASTGLRPVPDNPETVRLETHGGRAHPRFPSRSVAGWWTVDYESDEPLEGTFSVSYREADVWHLTDDYDNLKLRYSPDGGTTWEAPDLAVAYNRFTESSETGFMLTQGTVRRGTYVLEVEGEPAVTQNSGIMTSTRGREEVRVGAPNDYRIRYANSSDRETGPFLISIDLPDGMPVTSFRPSSQPGEPRQTWEPSDWDGSPNEITLVVPSMQPGEERHVDFVVTPDDPDLCLAPGKSPHSVAGVPLAIGVGIAIGTSKDYLVDLGANALEEVVADPFSKDVRGPMRDALDRTNQSWSSVEKPVGSLGSFAADGLLERGWLRRGVAVVGVASNVNTVMDAVSRGQRRYEERRAMGDPQPGPGPWGDYSYDYYYNTGHQYLRSEHRLVPVCSWDPNDKVGPGGAGEMGYVASAGVMDFRINFENMAEATAPAYRVVIVDTLDDVFDPATVEFGETSHDGFEITRAGNVLRWEIEGIELPPNVNPPEGEGWVDFTVHTRPDLASGTVLRNRATITFDINEPIVTEDHVNTLDLYPPQTSLLSIPETTENRELVLRWNADDGTDGSGVQSTTVYVAVDDGPFEVFDAAHADSMVFAGQPDSRYRFYAMSRDAVGNLEPGPSNIVETTFEYAVSADQIEAPLVFELEQNYPNPVHSSTSISYTLPALADIQLEVFDVLGRRVATLVSETQERGQHVATWDASSLASGMYLYRLKTGNHTATRQLVIVR